MHTNLFLVILGKNYVWRFWNDGPIMGAILRLQMWNGISEKVDGVCLSVLATIHGVYNYMCS